MNRKEFNQKLKELEACQDALNWVATQTRRTPKQIWDACDSPDWLIWLAFRLNPRLNWVIADLAVCVFAVRALAIAGLDLPAAELRNLPEIIDCTTANAAAKAAANEVGCADNAAYILIAVYFPATEKKAICVETKKRITWEMLLT